MDESTPAPAAPLPGSLSEDEIVAVLADYHAGALPPEQRAEVEAKLTDDPAWRALDDELRAPSMLAGLGKVAAPEQFAAQVTDTIHRRSAGRFFGRRTLGDRVPLGWLVVAAAVLLAGLTAVWCRSTTGSLRSPMGTETPRPAPTEVLAPRP